mmetsp:Transcript_25760/g.56011  ORF Transcript_25760/g.56011 Transcript_25760/m.56011 type:complete len:252 (-) Transcript_25760:212-967(-)
MLRGLVLLRLLNHEVVKNEQHHHHRCDGHQSELGAEHFVPQRCPKGAKHERNHDGKGHGVILHVLPICVAPANLHAECSDVLKVASDEGCGALQTVPHRHHVLDRKDGCKGANDPSGFLLGDDTSIAEGHGQLQSHHNDCCQGAENTPASWKLYFGKAVYDDAEKIGENDRQVENGVRHDAIRMIFRVDDTIAHLNHIACHHRRESLVPNETDSVDPPTDKGEAHSKQNLDSGKHGSRHCEERGVGTCTKR